MEDPVLLFFAVVLVAAVVYFTVVRKKGAVVQPEQPPEPQPVVSLHFQPAELTFGQSYTASWNSYKVESLRLTWTGPDGGNTGMSLSVPSGSVTNPTGPAGTYDFTLVGADVYGNDVATATATLVVKPAVSLPPIVIGPTPREEPVAEEPIVVGPCTPDTTLEVDTVEKDPIVIGPTPAVKKPAKKATKKPVKKATQKPTKQATKKR